LSRVKFKNKSYGIIEGTTNVYPQNLEETLYLFGEKGTTKVGGKSVNIIEEWRFGDGLDNPDDIKLQYAENPPNVYGFGHTPLYKDVTDAIRSNRKPYVDGLAGKRALELVLAIYKSSKEGCPVKLPLKDMDTLNMKGFFE
jgi:predicted dehydrogenase